MEVEKMIKSDHPDFAYRVQSNVQSLDNLDLRQRGKYESKWTGVSWNGWKQGWVVKWRQHEMSQHQFAWFLLGEFKDMDACRQAAEAFSTSVRPDAGPVDKVVFNIPATHFKLTINDPVFRFHGTTKTVIAIGLVSKLREKWVKAGGDSKDLGDVTIPIIRLPNPNMGQSFLDWLNQEGGSCSTQGLPRPEYFSGSFTLTIRHQQRMKWLVLPCTLTEAIQKFRGEFPMFARYHQKDFQDVYALMVPRESQQREVLKPFAPNTPKSKEKEILKPYKHNRGKDRRRATSGVKRTSQKRFPQKSNHGKVR